jgi:hypothetical protein
MSSNLLDSLKTLHAARRQASVSKYREIIFRHQSPKAEDLNELSSIIVELGVTPATVEADISAVNQVKRLEADRLSGAEREAISLQADTDRDRLLAQGRKEIAKRVLSVQLDRVPELASQVAILTMAMPETDAAVIACAEASHVLHLSEIKIRKAEAADERLEELKLKHPFLFSDDSAGGSSEIESAAPSTVGEVH